MILQFELSEENKIICGLEDEEIFYCLPLDIGSDGSYRNNSFLVITDRRILVLEEGVLTGNYELQEWDALKSEVGVGCGVLFGEKDGKKVLLGRFSAKHQVRYSYLYRGVQLLKQGSRETVISPEYEKSCPKCGKALPGISTCPRCTGKREGLFFTFFRMLLPHGKMLVAILLLMMGATVVTLVDPAIRGYLVDDVLLRTEKDYSAAAWALTGMFAMSVGIVVINAAKGYLCSKLGARISEDLRQKLFSKIQMLSLSFINDRSPGELINRVMRDTMRVKDFVGNVFCNMFTVVILFVCVCVYMLIMNYKLAIVAFLFVPVSVAVAASVRHRIRTGFHIQGMKSDKVNDNLQDVISGMAEVKSYGQEIREAERFEQNSEELAKIQKSNEVFFAVFYPSLTFLLGAGTYLVTFFGGRETLLGDMTPGKLLQFISYTGLLYQYTGWLTNTPRMLMNMITSLERIGDVMHQEPSIADGPHAVRHDVKGEIEFRKASFGYRSYQPVLEGIDLHVKPGEMIGFVGASGTGKSTMINLIMHLYEVDDGELLVDGINIKDIKLDHYHSQIGVVLQENFLFSGTIINNIRFARPEATYEEVVRAAKMANAHDFICKTPDGYNTYVGEHGHNLSGGERQRIAIARAILCDPKLLILDEATASLDTESEYLIQQALGRLREGRTTFAIAHRLSTLKDADRLVVIDGRKIAEVGSHEELMERKGIYYGLVQAQLQMQNRNKDLYEEI